MSNLFTTVEIFDGYRHFTAAGSGGISVGTASAGGLATSAAKRGPEDATEGNTNKGAFLFSYRDTGGGGG
jgi:hypothetical protein